MTCSYELVQHDVLEDTSVSFVKSPKITIFFSDIKSERLYKRSCHRGISTSNPPRYHFLTLTKLTNPFVSFVYWLSHDFLTLRGYIVPLGHIAPFFLYRSYMKKNLWREKW